MIPRLFAAACMFAIVSCASIGPVAHEPALPRTLVFGGTIYTGASDRPTVEAIVISGDHVEFVGDLAAARSPTDVGHEIDLRGAVAYPGFTDAHAHLYELGQWTAMLDLAQARSVADLVQSLADYAQQSQRAIIEGYGWLETAWPERRVPTASDLDVVSDRPVILTRVDGHAVVVNSFALRWAGITAESPDPPGGLIDRDRHGEPTGLLIDRAIDLVTSRVAPPTSTERADAIRRGVRHASAAGWTSVHNLEASQDDVAILDRMALAGELPIRVDNFMRLADADHVLDSGPYKDETGLVRVRGVKLYSDGALGSRGALLFEPYADAGGTGVQVMDTPTLLNAMTRARASCAQVAVHAIGDRGNRLALDTIEQVLSRRPRACNFRWRVEHAQILSESDIPRFGRLGVIASMQPSHALTDLHFAADRLGLQRLAGAYAWRSLLDSGAVVAGGSDAPVELGLPTIEFYAAVYRHDLNGFAGEGWHLEQTVDRSAALRMFTWAPAYAVSREDEMGILAPGRLADLSVFSADLMTIPPREIPRVRPIMTIVGGRIVMDNR